MIILTNLCLLLLTRKPGGFLIWGRIEIMRIFRRNINMNFTTKIIKEVTEGILDIIREMIRRWINKEVNTA
jgi:hypothetical protein